MNKPMISLGMLVAILQSCSGKPVGFQGETASISGSTTTTGDTNGRSMGNRDGTSDDATASSGNGIEGQSIESENIEMEAANIFEGSDITITIPGETDQTSNSGSSNNTSSNNTPAAAIAPLTLTIQVPSTSLRSGSSPMQATAKVTGQSTAADVTWTAKADMGRSTGTVDSNGLYTAPASGGGYDITLTATLNDDPSIMASVVIKIVVPEQIFVGCQQGSEFFPITADVYQLPAQTAKLPNFSSIGAKLTTVCMDQYNIAPRDWSTGFPGLPGLFEWFALRTSTHLVAASDGIHTFKLNSDDGAKLYIDGQLVIDNDGQHAPTAKEASISLTAGDHVLSIDYFQGPRYQIALELYWKIPGSSTYVYVPRASFK